MKSTSIPRLETGISASLSPVLRADGFRGSGRKFCGRFGDWLQVVTVQGSRWGGSFAVNLGIHFAAAPDVIGNLVDPNKITEANCEFRRRLSDTKADYWWEHDRDAMSMLLAMQSASEIYQQFGREYFFKARMALDGITPLDLESGGYDLLGFSNTKPRLGLALARIRKLQGNTDASRGFAAFALKHLGMAGFLRGELEELASK